MKKRMSLFVLSTMMMVLTIYGNEKVISLDQLISPFYVRVDHKQLYVSDGPTLSIFDLKEFKRLKKFGKQGEGPGEFMVSPTQNLGSFLFDILDNHIIIQTIGKISYFTINGKYVKEIRTSRFGLKPIGENFVGYGSSADSKGTPLITINLYDKTFRVKKELHREKAFHFRLPKISPFDFKSSLFMVYKKLIITEKGRNRIDILNRNGDLIHTIQVKEKKKKITESDKKKYLSELKVVPQVKPYLEEMLARIYFPEYFPGISMFDVADDRIYLITHDQSSQGRKVLVYNLTGKYLGSIHIKPFFSYIFLPKSFAFGNNKFYQINENTQKETNELFITSIDLKD